MIGHELSHGFDDQGRKFDGNGNLTDWWTEADAKAFEERAACIADQYSGYSPVNDPKTGKPAFLNGKLTLGENIGDNGGVRIAFMALMNTLDGEGPHGLSTATRPSSASSSASRRCGARTPPTPTRCSGSSRTRTRPAASARTAPSATCRSSSRPSAARPARRWRPRSGVGSGRAGGQTSRLEAAGCEAGGGGWGWRWGLEAGWRRRRRRAARTMRCSADLQVGRDPAPPMSVPTLPCYLCRSIPIASSPARTLVNFSPTAAGIPSPRSRTILFRVNAANRVASLCDDLHREVQALALVHRLVDCGGRRQRLQCRGQRLDVGQQLLFHQAPGSGLQPPGLVRLLPRSPTGPGARSLEPGARKSPPMRILQVRIPLQPVLVEPQQPA